MLNLEGNWWPNRNVFILLQVADIITVSNFKAILTQLTQLNVLRLNGEGHFIILPSSTARLSRNTKCMPTFS